MQLDEAQVRYVLRVFQRNSSGSAHTSVWSRRSYAPMLIFAPELHSLRTELEARFPDHLIAFDVVFESEGGPVAWHCDYESLGPFFVPNRWRAVRDAHFLSVHFNLTDRGGRLQTLAWPRLSYLHYLCISTFGIFGVAHTLLAWASTPFFWLCGIAHSNARGRGNAFDNMLLHAVTAGDRRTSYVVRLVRRSCVRLSSESVCQGMRRSAACEVFGRLLPRLATADATDGLRCEDVDWSTALGPP